MLFDTHCHLDRFPNPLAVAREAEQQGVVTIGMTGLPEHFEAGLPHVRQFKWVRLALGLHPLLVAKHFAQVETFARLATETSYIGEVGLDFSREGVATGNEQRAALSRILDIVGDRPRFISLHSRKAEAELLAMLKEKNVKQAVLHWFTGPISVALDAVEDGHFFSVNPAMVKSASGRKLIERIPGERIVTETDGPYVRVRGRPAQPSDVRTAIEGLADVWGSAVSSAEARVAANMLKLLSGLRSSE